MTGDDRAADSLSDVDVIIADYMAAVDSGQPVDRQDWLRRYPAAAKALTEFFNDQDGFAERIAPLRQCLSGDGVLESGKLPEVGARLGNYELLELIARGGMGVVFKARQLDLNRIVALKMISRGSNSSAADQERFRQEAEAVARLDHPNIVPIYEIDAWEGQPCFSMRFIEGGNLAQWIASHKDTGHSLPAAAQCMAKVAQAVHFAHQHGILHRDLKPANILLQADPNHPDGLGCAIPFVADFGLAKLQENVADSVYTTAPTLDGQDATPRLTQTGIAVGTPSYMAPEQVPNATGGNSLTTASDIYSLGAVLYELVTREPPFRAATVAATLQQVASQPARPPRQINDRIPLDLEAICLKCLEKEPAKRYGSAEALAADLERFVNGEPIEARPIGRVNRIWRWSRQQPALASACAVAIVGLVSAAVISGLFAVSESRGRSAIKKSADELEAAFEKQSRLANERQTALIDAEEQRKRAEHNYRQAIKAVDDFYVRFSVAGLSKLPGKQPMQREMLTAALQHFQDFLKQKGDDPALRLDVARTCVRVADINAQLGSRDDAFTHYARAIAVTAALLREDAANREARRWQALAYLNRGVLLLSMDRHQEALESGLAAAERYRDLLKDGAQDPEVRQHLASLLSNMGDQHRTLRQFTPARECLREASDILQPLLPKHPRHAPYQEIEGNIFVNLGALEQALGNKDESLDHYQKARVIFDDLAKRYPTERRYQHLHAVNLYRVAIPLNNRGRIKEGVPLLEKSRAMLDALIRENPGVANYLVDWATTTRSLGDFQRGRKDFVKALELYREVQARIEPDDVQKLGGDALRRELALTHHAQATVHLKRKDAAKALASVDQSLELRRNRINEQAPFNDRHALGESLALRGEILADLGKHDEAVQSIRSGISFSGKNVDAAPQVPTYVQAVHDQYKLLVKVQKDKSPGAGLKAWQEAQDHFLALVGKHPEEHALRRTLARVLVDHALDLRLQKRPVDARIRLQKAIMELDRLLPGDRKGNLAELAHAHFQLALTLGVLRDADLELAHYQKACDLQRDLIKLAPSAQADSSLGTFLHNLGMLYHRRANPELAEATLRLAAEHQKRALDKSPQSLGVRQSLSGHLANLAVVLRSNGKVADAVAVALQRQDIWPENPQELVEVARDLGLSANRLATPAKKRSPTEQAEIDRVADLALAALRRAADKGFSNWTEINEHAAFQVVRARPGFQQLAKPSPR